jgi:hypothetical protein
MATRLSACRDAAGGSAFHLRRLLKIISRKHVSIDVATAEPQIGGGRSH